MSALRGLILVKRHGAKVVRPFAKPVSAVGRFLIRVVGVPVYRLVFYVQRQLGHVLLPAKNRVLYLVSNRYAVHAAVIAIAAVASSANLSQTQVRAETFGSHSMLYELVAQDDTQTVEVVSASNDLDPDAKPLSYEDDPALDAFAHMDIDYAGEDYVGVASGDSVGSPTLSGGSVSVAARDAVESYAVQEGDTLGDISDRFGLSLSTLLWANELTFKSTIRPGQSLVIPPVDGVLYTVKKGDTISSIVKKYGADSAQVIAFNKLASADDLSVGDSLMLPGGEPPAPVAKTTTKPLSSLFSTPSGSSFKAPKGDGEVSGTWVWPTDWHIITQPFGWKHTGVDIDGDYGTHSYAAAAGTVIYSGWRNGYGNTVEINHSGGVVTRYAHHSKLLVQAGDKVVVGQTIAVTGSTGRSTGTHLHFEVIVNGKFQNPLNYVR